MGDIIELKTSVKKDGDVFTYSTEVNGVKIERKFDKNSFDFNMEDSKAEELRKRAFKIFASTYFRNNCEVKI